MINIERITLGESFDTALNDTKDIVDIFFPSHWEVAQLQSEMVISDETQRSIIFFLLDV